MAAPDLKVPALKIETYPLFLPHSALLILEPLDLELIAHATHGLNEVGTVV